MTRPPPEERPTARDLAARAAGNDPWACPRCGCKDWRVEDSYMTAEGRKRRRICRHCGQELLRTTEVVVPKGFKATVIPIEEPNEEAAA